jgi:hypothetical protein
MNKIQRYINTRPTRIIHQGKFKGLPRCIVPKCQKPRMLTGKFDSNNNPLRGNVCLDHKHSDLIAIFTEHKNKEKMAEERCARNAGYSSFVEYHKDAMLRMAKKAGFNTVSEYSKHKATLRAKKRGYINVTELTKAVCSQTAINFGFDSRTEYRKHRQDDKAKRLGFATYSAYRAYKKKQLNEEE